MFEGGWPEEKEQLMLAKQSAKRGRFRTWDDVFGNPQRWLRLHVDTAMPAMKADKIWKKRT